MTLPEQSDRAVAQTRAFLVRLSSPYVEGGIKGIRREVRAEALALLRHYPFSYRTNDENRGNDDMSGATAAWIPVSERLPEEECRCLLVIRGEVMSATYYPPGKFQPGITHWMPLPAPPEVT